MRRIFLAIGVGLLALVGAAAGAMAQEAASPFKIFKVPAGSHPHDVAADRDGRTVWYTAQHQGALGRLDSQTGAVRQIALGNGSSPHGVIVGPDGAAWVTDSGLNAIVRVDAKTEAVAVFPLPAGTPYTNLNTAAFDGAGVLWFTGQSGYFGRLDPGQPMAKIFPAPKGRGPYGIAATPKGEVYYVSLAGSYLALLDSATSQARVIEPPTPNQGARRVWSDSKGRQWISEWLSGDLSRYDPAERSWKRWRLPGAKPSPYAVYVDEADIVWITDFSANALVRFDPATEAFQSFTFPHRGAKVRQILGIPGEVWLPASGADHLYLLKTR